MIEKAFAEFVEQNIVTLDELACRYAEYRKEVTQAYWDELRILVQKNTPRGYVFEGGDTDLFKGGECVCGWSWPLDDSGSKVTVAFGVHLTFLNVALGRWPFSDKTCWTGVRVWASSEFQSKFFDMGQRQILNTEPRDRNWLFWRFWRPQQVAELQNLHYCLTQASDASREDILKELKLWQQTVEPIFKSTPLSE